MQLVALFSPEHGLAGRNDDKRIASTKDAADRLAHLQFVRRDAPSYRRHAQRDRRLVFDLQDVGVRFYTYPQRWLLHGREAAKRNIAFVFDRPNPLGGEIVEGPMLDPDKTSFTAYFPLPVRYGLTIGELAEFFLKKKITSTAICT